MLDKRQSCNLCKEEDLDEFVDGKTEFGPWANMCASCYATTGMGIGVGLGQHYKWDEEKQRYIKVGG